MNNLLLKISSLAILAIMANTFSSYTAMSGGGAKGHSQSTSHQTKAHLPSHLDVKEGDVIIAWMGEKELTINGHKYTLGGHISGEWGSMFLENIGSTHDLRFDYSPHHKHFTYQSFAPGPQHDHEGREISPGVSGHVELTLTPQ